MTSPRDLTLAAFRSGAVTRRAIVATTQLNADVVDLIVDLLVRSGEISVQSLKLDCRPDGCRGCWQLKGCSSRLAP